MRSDIEFIKSEIAKMRKLRKKACFDKLSMSANLPFYVVMAKPRPSLSQHDDSEPTLWHPDDAIFILSAANRAEKFCEALERATQELANIKEMQELLGGESVLLDDVNEALSDIARVMKENE